MARKSAKAGGAKKDLLRAAEVFEDYKDDIPRIGKVVARQFHEDVEGYREIGGHLRKGRVKKAAKKYGSEIRRRAKGAGELAVATLPLAVRFVTNPSFAPPEGISVVDYAQWRKSANYYLTDMMGDIPEMSDDELKALISSSHPMSWQCGLELEFRALGGKQLAKKNRSLRPVPRGMSGTPRSAATSLYVFPRRRSFPIGDLFHAKMAVEWATTWPNLKQFKHEVLRAVEKAYPDYDWRGYSGELEMRQRARKNPNQSDVQIYQDILGLLRAIQWVAWTAHWTASGPEYYSDHQLLQRLYAGEGGPDINEAIDALGERMVFHFGTRSVNPSVVQEFVSRHIARHQGSNPFESLLLLERSLQAAIKVAWQLNQKAGANMSLGMDDYLMGLANERDTIRYLLQRRVAASGY